MKTDNSASIIFGLYTKPDKYKRFLEIVKEKKIPMTIREIRFIDVSFGIQHKDEVINFFKHFMLCDFWAQRNPLLTNNFFVNKALDLIEKKASYKKIIIKSGDWLPDCRNELLFTFPVPLFYQSDLNDKCTEDWERKAFKEIETFKSYGYEADRKEIQDETKVKPYKGEREVL